MTNVEVWQLVKAVYAAYNQVAYDSDKKALTESWGALLGEYAHKEVFDKAMELCAISKVMPTPGGIRRYLISATSPDGRPPTVQEAWAWVQKRSQEAASGIMSDETPHPVILSTMKAIAPVVQSLSTNGDREYFSQVYNAKLLEYEIELYKVKHEA